MWKVRPSALLDIEDPYIAYCLDEAVAYVGAKIQGDLDDVEGDNKREIEANQQAILDRYFPPENGDITTAPKGRFRDPAAMFGPFPKA